MAKKNGSKNAGHAAKAAKTQGAKREGSLAAIIDPYLIGGGHLVRDIAAEVARKAGEAAKGRDIEANVRARIVSFKRKGWSVVKDAEKRVKVVQAKA